MTTWTRFEERNEGERELWTFWIRTEGNESELARLGEIVDSLTGDYEEPFQVLDPIDIREDQVDALVAYGGEGYMRLHTKLVGKLQLPTEAPDGDWFPILYKGGIADLVVSDV